MSCSFRSTRHSEPGVRVGTLAAAAVVLGGCSSLSLPERFEIPANGEDFRTRVYAGATMGNSHLTPDTRGTVFNVDDTEDLGTQITLGVDVHNALAVELDTSILGTATLREANTDVNYSAASISALVYGLNGVQLRSRREGWSAFGRLGLGVLKKSSAVLALDESGTVPILGAGAEYGFPNGLGVRGEISRFDEDAVYLGLGAVYRFGLTPREVGGLIAEVAEPVLSSTDTRVAEGGRVLDRPFRGDRNVGEDRSGGPSTVPTGLRHASRWRPAVRADDRDRDGVRDARDRCPDTQDDVTVDRTGCGLFDAVLEDVVFKSGSTWLTARARGELDRLAVTLLAFPEAKVRVLAHTDSSGPADENLALSARRAESVVQYLETRGVSELQLEARGLGETRPLASNRDPEGRRLNRRIEIETLANLDAPGRTHPLGRDDRNEPVRWRPPAPVRPAPVARPVATTARPAAPSKSAPETPPKSAPKAARSTKAAEAPVATARTDGGETLAADVMAEVAAAAANGAAAASEAVTGEVSAEGEPAVAAARPLASTDARALASTAIARPAPLPAPGFVAGLEIGGVIENVRFVEGSAELLPAASVELARIAGELAKFPEARVAIMAHTDDRGSEADNVTLSEARARSVLEQLVEHGVEPERLEAEGYGESLPIAQNVTPEDRARNRRVELRVLR